MLHAVEGVADGRDRRALRLDADGNLLHRARIRRRLPASVIERRAQALALGLERSPAVLERLHLREPLLERLTRRAGLGLVRSDAGGRLADLLHEPFDALGSLLGARPQRVQLRAGVDLVPVRRVRLALLVVPAVFKPPQLLACLGERRLDRGCTLGRLGRSLAQRAKLALALENAGVRVLVSGHPQPALADPDAVAGDDGFARPEPAPQCQRFGESIHGRHASKQPRETPWAADLGGQAGRHRLRGAFERHEADAARAESVDHLGNRIEAVDADGLEVVAQNGLDGALPARLDLDLLGHPRTAGKPVPRQPLHDAALDLPERRLLQRLERHQPAPRLLCRVARGVEVGAQRAFASPCGMERLQGARDRRLQARNAFPASLLKRRGARGLGLEVDRRQRLTVPLQPLALRKQAVQAQLELLYAGPFDQRLARRRRGRRAELLPSGLPLLHRLLGGCERGPRGLLGGPGRVEFRLALGHHGGQLVELLLVAGKEDARLVERGRDRFEVVAQAVAQLARVAQRLLAARGLGTSLIVATLDAAQLVVALGMQRAGALDPGFAAAKRRDRCLHRKLPLA